MKRVYDQAGVAARGDGFAVTLDGRPVMTPAKSRLVLPTEALAAAIAREWQDQDEEVRPDAMPLMRLACAAIDRVSGARDQVVDEVAAYAGTDLLCYRADQPDELAARQSAVWQPLLDWAAEAFGERLQVTAGLVPLQQSAAALAAYRAPVAAADDLTLTGLHAATTACGSLVLGLALARRRIDAESAYAASQLDEIYQIEKWGDDAEAAQRLSAIRDDIAAAERLFRLLEAGPGVARTAR